MSVFHFYAPWDANHHAFGGRLCIPGGCFTIKGCYTTGRFADFKLRLFHFWDESGRTWSRSRPDESTRSARATFSQVIPLCESKFGKFWWIPVKGVSDTVSFHSILCLPPDFHPGRTVWRNKQPRFRRPFKFAAKRLSARKLSTQLALVSGSVQGKLL